MGYYLYSTAGEACVCIPDPDQYWDGSTLAAQIGTNSFSSADLSTTVGKFDTKSLEFGSTDTHEPAILADAITLNGTYSWCFWFLTKQSDANWGSLLRGDGAGSVNYAIVTEDSTDNLGVYLASTATFYSSGYDMTALEGSTEWHHIAVVATASSGASGGSSKFYIDGSLVGTSAAAINGIGMKEIGAYSGGSGQQVFSEYLDEIAYWPVALSATQISKIYTENKKISAIAPMNW